MSQDSIPLPEIHAVPGDFLRAWTRFELIAKAKEWNEEKQLVVLPTLLRGKLIDYYSELPADVKGNLEELKKALQERAGLIQDPFSASMIFTSRNQKDDERAADFAIELTKLFKQAYPEENTTSAVLLQRFVTGLRPSIRCQLLLKKRPENMSQTVKDAEEIEQTLNLHEEKDDFVGAVGVHKRPREEPQWTALQETLEKVTKRLESLEVKMQQNQDGDGNRQPRRRRQYRTVGPCYKCGQNGHLQYRCPLNSKGSAVPPVNSDSWPQQQ